MGGGGGQGSGKVGYAAYLEGSHKNLIGDYTTYSVDTNLVEVLNTMMAASPYATMVAFDPSTDLTAMLTALSVYDTTITNLLNETVIAADVAAYADILDDEIDSKVVPNFNARMRDIGAVVSSSYAVGLSNIWGMRDRDVAKYAAGMRIKREELTLAAREIHTKTKIDVHRMTIAAKHDKQTVDNEIDVQDANWDIECLLKGGQILGCLGGGTHIPDKPSKLQSALSAGLSGAAMGTMIAPGIGTAIGGVIGFGSAFV